MHTLVAVGFEWDTVKATTNLQKHGTDFADPVGIFDDPFALSMPGETLTEQRFVGLGADLLGRLLVVVYTLRGERVRIVSARRATPSERRAYEVQRR